MAMEPAVKIHALALSLVLALAGCSVSPNYKLADDASRTFDLLADRHQYRAIYDQASPGFQSTVTRERLVALLEAIRPRRREGRLAVHRILHRQHPQQKHPDGLRPGGYSVF